MVTADYDFELERIKKIGAKSVLIQLPDGLKNEATGIYDSLKSTAEKIYIWTGSCFGFCDIPDVKNVDLVVQLGHNKFIQ